LYSSISSEVKIEKDLTKGNKISFEILSGSVPFPESGSLSCLSFPVPFFFTFQKYALTPVVLFILNAAGQFLMSIKGIFSLILWFVLNFINSK
jgi:hypothetical protein